MLVLFIYLNCIFVVIKISTIAFASKLHIYAENF